jgi:2-amino-4-hydroxy-6-hydroxymethyldihydropteridine diphosphokinase/dihydropteroate synthase
MDNTGEASDGIYLGFGSNHGDRADFLRRGIAAMVERGLVLECASCVVESPALLPAGSPWDWNRPFLNCVARFSSPTLKVGVDALNVLRQWIDEIQAECGRPHASRWAPRPLDIDILLWGDAELTAGKVRLPHPDIVTRNFVLSPLASMAPGLKLPGDPSGRTVLEYSRALPHHIPMWMGILNITPDSFSDGGRFVDWSPARAQVDTMCEHGVHVIDVGAESTRPGATPLGPDQEWARLDPILAQLLEHLSGDPLRPQISVDTYHPEVAARCLDVGVDIINDVSGLQSPAMLELASGTAATFIAMHNLGVPAARDVTLPPDCDPLETLTQWIEMSLEFWQRRGLSVDRTVIDPGIGFGKDSLQSLHLLRHVRDLAGHGVRVLVGHSRKSFMKRFTAPDDFARDLTTVGASLNLCAQGVDIIRVHDVPMHAVAYRGWSHLVGMSLPPAERQPVG